MKIRFCNYIKNAKVGNTFYSVDTGDYYKITKIAKKYTFAIERLYKGAKKKEEVEWTNDATDRIIY